MTKRNDEGRKEETGKKQTKKTGAEEKINSWKV